MGVMVTQKSVFNQLGSKPSSTSQEPIKKICKFWVSGRCIMTNRCRNLHPWFSADNISMLTRLEGHKEAITGIALPIGSDRLYSAARDGTMRIWNCYSGECNESKNLGDQIGCLISKDSWVFVGLPNVVKAWNINNHHFCDLEGPVGQVYAIAASHDTLFAGAQDGVISAWKGCCEENPFKFVGSLKGHTKSVMCLTVGGGMLYSGSMDNSIRVWNLETLECVQTLKGHTGIVMSLLYWGRYLLSCSLDKTIKVWAMNEDGKLEVVYIHNEQHGAIALCGMHDQEGKPILLCSFKDHVRLFELPSFKERGKIFSKREVGMIQSGPCGLFFTGDGLGVLSVWTWLADSSKEAS